MAKKRSKRSYKDSKKCAKVWKFGKRWCAIRPGLKHPRCTFKSRAAALRGIGKKRR